MEFDEGLQALDAFHHLRRAARAFDPGDHLLQRNDVLLGQDGFASQGSQPVAGPGLAFVLSLPLTKIGQGPVRG